MKQNRKYLRISSIVVLIFSAITLLNLVCELLFGEINTAALPEGSPENILLIAKIFLLAITLLILWPQLYIGFKGLKMAKKPDASKRHITWGTVLLVISVIALLSPLSVIVRGDLTFENFSEFFSILAEVIVFYDYVKYAKAVRKEI